MFVVFARHPESIVHQLGKLMEDAIIWILTTGWAACGLVAANRAGSLGLWRITIWLGPLALLIFRRKK